MASRADKADAACSRPLSVFSQAQKLLVAPPQRAADDAPAGAAAEAAKPTVPARRKKQKKQTVSKKHEGAPLGKSKVKGVDSYAPPGSIWAKTDRFFKDVTSEDIEPLVPMSDAELASFLILPESEAHYSEQWAMADLEAREQEAIVRASLTRENLRWKLLHANPSQKRKALRKTGRVVSHGCLVSPNQHPRDACDVCYGGESSASNKILFCDVCEVSVHQDCYDLPKVPEASWTCLACQLDQRKLTCLLCCQSGGALKQVLVQNVVQKDVYAHPFCCLWLPQTYIAKSKEHGLGCILDSVNNPVESTACSICSLSSGICVECSQGTAHSFICHFLHLWLLSAQ